MHYAAQQELEISVLVPPEPEFRGLHCSVKLVASQTNLLLLCRVLMLNTFSYVSNIDLMQHIVHLGHFLLEQNVGPGVGYHHELQIKVEN